MGKRLRRSNPNICELKRGLGSSVTGGEKVDIVASAWFRSAKAWAIDVTVSNPMLPTYIAAAIDDAMAIFRLREKEKDDKHGPGSTAMNRQFAAAVFSTFGGVRGAEFIKIITALFQDSITADRRARHAWPRCCRSARRFTSTS